MSLSIASLLHQRASGILLPLFSLPGPFGIGDIGPTAFRFIDFLAQAGQCYWQILPVGPTAAAFCNSPYMSPSAFAGNPLYISPERLVTKGLLEPGEVLVTVDAEHAVDYKQAAHLKQKLLRLAWQRFDASPRRGELKTFITDHPWVEDYSLFQACKKHCHNQAWFEWPKGLKKRQPEALKKIVQDYQDDVEYFTFEQYLFFSQWQELKAYGREKEVSLIGDIPMYIAADSADAWSQQDIFQLDPATSRPTQVAGVPPDYFSKTGQLWGNPLYKWNTTKKATKKALWKWWEERLRHNFLLTDVVRIDHFRGFESYWSVPAEEETAINGKWKKGPGFPFFKEMKKRIGELPIIAEDLGTITPPVEKLRKDLNFPGMRILLFAFDGSPDNSYLPHWYEPNTVVYTGTHDNDTAVGWYMSPEIEEESKKQAKNYAHQTNLHESIFHQDMIYLALSSVANTAILPMQDVLGFGNDCRINTPGTVAHNWQWRCAQRFITDELASWLYDKTALFGRLPQKTVPKGIQKVETAEP
ncbi:MAG: 4-alpha-glucanotransferase [Desulfobulbus propionicus]|nr:MAG: 4-alpha-glucanotransferase [Desulfobulbus propionicus]